MRYADVELPGLPDKLKDMSPAEARVLYIHPVVGMRVEYLDEERTRGFVHNADTWEWVGLK